MIRPWLVSLLFVCFGFASVSAEDLDLSDALGTSGIIWSAPESHGTRASVVLDPSAEGGSMVSLPARNSIATTLADEYLVKIRFRKSTVMVNLNGDFLSSRSVVVAPGDEGTGWLTGTYAMTEPGEFAIGTYGSDSEVDSVVFVPRPESLAEALGLAEGSITVGGSSSWVISPGEEAEDYGAKVNLSEVSPEGWLEFSATGPAKVKVRYFQQSSVTLQVIADAKVRWDSSEDEYYGNQVALEIPAGVHPIRLRGGLSRNWDSRPGIIRIDDIEIVSLPVGGVVLAAMDDLEPWAMNSEWVPGAVVREGGDSLRPAADDYVQGVKLKRSFTGPGTVSFWSYVGESPDGDVELEWSTNFSDPEERRSSDDESGWRKTSIWIPSGEHWIRWEASGHGDQFHHLALDEIEFVASPEVAISEAFGASPITWRNDPTAPWTAFVRDGAGVAVSALTAGEDEPGSTTLTATLPGPGKFSFRWAKRGHQGMRAEFWIDGIKHSDLGRGLPESVEVGIPHEMPVEVKWVGDRQSDWSSWIEIDQVGFVPLEEVSLAEALDTPSGVTWQSSVESPVRGRANSGAKNGSAAHLSVVPGGETWLEATVEGAGVFDFWLRVVPGAPYDLHQVGWELFVDGIKSDINSWNSTWPAQWILGAGTHQIRLVFRNDGDRTLSIAVDDVLWKPLSAADEDTSWTASHPEITRGFSNGGLNGGPQHVLPVATGEIRWMEKSVTGPGLLAWNESYTYGNSPAARLKVVLDGLCALPEQGSWSWVANRLYIPAGVHTVRWISEPELYEGEPYRVQTDAVWRISGMTFTPGMPELMTAIEGTDHVWLAIGGEEGGALAGTDAHDGVDAWSMGDETVLYLCNAGENGLMANGMVYRTEFGNGIPQWSGFSRWAGPGEVVEWVSARSVGFGIYVPPCVIDSSAAESLVVVPFKEAVEVEQEISSEGWVGLRNDSVAFDGYDSGLSRLTSLYQKNEASISVQGPAKVRFRWKTSGNGKFGVLVDGAWLPVATPEGNWKEVEFDVAGISEVTWLHAAIPGTSLDAPGDAWIDTVSVTPVPERSLDEAAGAGSGLHFTSAEVVEDGRAWKSAAFRDADGIWREGARGVAADEQLRTIVTGPAIVSFRLYCANVTIPDPVGLSKSVIIVSPFPGMQVEGRYLGVRVGDREILRLSGEEASGWQEHRFHVPAGDHVVSWAVGAIRSYGYPPEVAVPDWQAWVTEVAVKDPRSDYDQWAAIWLQGNTSGGPKDDADGDGQINFLEYAYGSDPDDVASRSPEMFGSMSRSAYRLFIPRLPAHVPGVLMTSEDLVDWNPSVIPLRSSPLLSRPWPFFEPVFGEFDSGIHQVIEFDASAGRKSKFFRIELTPP